MLDGRLMLKVCMHIYVYHTIWLFIQCSRLSSMSFITLFSYRLCMRWWGQMVLAAYKWMLVPRTLCLRSHRYICVFMSLFVCMHACMHACMHKLMLVWHNEESQAFGQAWVDEIYPTCGLIAAVHVYLIWSVCVYLLHYLLWCHRLVEILCAHHYHVCVCVCTCVHVLIDMPLQHSISLDTLYILYLESPPPSPPPPPLFRALSARHRVWRVCAVCIDRLKAFRGGGFFTLHAFDRASHVDTDQNLPEEEEEFLSRKNRFNSHSVSSADTRRRKGSLSQLYSGH